MRLALLLSCLLVVSSVCSQQTDCLNANLYAIATNNASDTGVTDLEFLREILKDKDIVALGEAEHGAGSDFEAKTRLVKFLHQELGFNVIAFESGMYDCEKAWQLIQSGENADTVVGKGIYGVWSESRQMQPLFHYIEEQKSKPRPLLMTGFDIQFSGSLKGSTARQYLAKDFTAMVQKYEPQLLNENWWGKFINDLDSITGYKRADSMMLVRYLDTIQAKLVNLPSNKELAFWLQWMKSTQHYLTDQINRDRYMAENFVWLRNNLFPNEKIILWGASLHFMYGFESFKNLADRNYIKKEYLKVPMGHYLKQQYGDKLYTIASTFYEGNMAWAWEKDGRTFPPAAKNMIEYSLNTACKGAHCYLDLSKMPADCLWKSKPIRTRAFGITERLLPGLAFDGIVFHKRMERSYLAE